MKKTIYVTAEEMKKIDKAAIEQYRIPAARLMEKAGKAAASEALKIVKKGSHALVVSGYGNNGGDGFVAARYLIKEGIDVSLFLAGKPRILTPEAEHNLGALMDLECPSTLISSSGETEKAFSRLGRCDLVIDAIFGTGIKGRLDQFYVALIEKINSIGAPVVSIDIPSGLDADTGLPCPSAIKASRTVTLALQKAGFRNSQALRYTGKVIVADIGIPRAAVADVLDNSGKA